VQEDVADTTLAIVNYFIVGLNTLNNSLVQEGTLLELYKVGFSLFQNLQ